MTKGKAASTRIRIIDCAVELYKTREYASVTVHDICSFCGLTRSAFYYHFNSKDELLDEYFLQTDLHIIQQLAPRLSQLSPATQLDQILLLYMQRATESGAAVLSTLFQHSLSSGKCFSFPKNKTVCSLVLSALEQGQTDGTILNPAPPFQLFQAITCFNTSLCLTYCAKNGKWDIIHQYRTLLHTLLLSQPEESPQTERLPPMGSRRRTSQ